jgi:hypothetical protein
MSNSKVRKPNVVRGGTAIPLGRNYYYMSGRKHETGGIDIGKNPRTGLEVEDGEVMHVTKDEVKVFSAQPFLNGESPAQRVMQGDNPNTVFNAQERFKKRNKLNDDGTKKKRMGGKNKNHSDSLRSELRAINKYRAGGLYSVTVDGITKLKMFPSTGELQRTDKMKFGGRRKATLGNDKKFKEGEDYEMVREEDFPVRNKREFYTPNKDAISLINKTNNYDPFMANSYFSLQRKISSLRNNKQTTINNIEDDTNNNASTNTSKSYTGNTKRSTKSTNKSKLIPTTSTTSVASTPPPSIVSPRVDLSSLAAPVPSLKYIDKTKLKSGVPARENLGRRTINYVKNNPNTIEDAIGLTSNIIGGLISHAANRKMLNNLKYSSAPAARTAAKLKTHININPQLDKMRESLAAYERDVNANTASSRVALARKQRARLASALNTNELYADKENKETELINKDRLNQQAVAAENIRDYNKWAESKAAFNRAVLEKKAENDVGLINTINAGVQNVLSNIGKRRSENKTIATMALANPDLPIELFYKEGIVNKRVRDAYRKAYPIKRKKKD